MRFNISEIYSEMYKQDITDSVFSDEIIKEQSKKSDRFALDDYTKLIYEQSESEE
jgi:hypothetical protein